MDLNESRNGSSGAEHGESEGSEGEVVGADRAAFDGADLVSYWDASEGGWSTLLRGPGSRVAAAGYSFAAAALNAADGDGSPLSAADLEVNRDGAFTSRRLSSAQSAVISAELNPAAELLERLTLALEVAFELGVRRAIEDSSAPTGA